MVGIKVGGLVVAVVWLTVGSIVISFEVNDGAKVSFAGRRVEFVMLMLGPSLGTMLTDGKALGVSLGLILGWILTDGVALGSALGSADGV